jgi:hypothetical protein
MNREQRLQSARSFIRDFKGRNIARGYSRWFGVDPMTTPGSMTSGDQFELGESAICSASRPWIDERDSRCANMSRVSGHKRQTVMKCRCRKLRVDGRKRQPLPLRKRLDLSPTLRGSCIEGEHPRREPNADVPIEPALECSPLPFGFIEQIDSFSDFADRDHAQIQQLFRRAFDPLRDTARRPWPHELGDDIGVQEVA